MKPEKIQNVIVDEANERTYVVSSARALSDGEIYKAIRMALLRRRGEPVARGETLAITFSPEA